MSRLQWCFAALLTVVPMGLIGCTGGGADTVTLDALVCPAPDLIGAFGFDETEVAAGDDLYVRNTTSRAILFTVPAGLVSEFEFTRLIEARDRVLVGTIRPQVDYPMTYFLGQCEDEIGGQSGPKIVVGSGP